MVLKSRVTNQCARLGHMLLCVTFLYGYTFQDWSFPIWISEHDYVDRQNAFIFLSITVTRIHNSLAYSDRLLV